MITDLNNVKVMYAGDKATTAGVFIPRDELDTMYESLIKVSKKLIKKDLFNSARERIAVAEFVVELTKKFEGML